MKTLRDVVEKVKSDKELRPYFLDFICKNLVLGMSDVFTVNSVDRTRIQKEFYESLHSLSEQLQKEVQQESLHPIIEEVSKYYLGKIGRVSFEQYPTN